MQLQGTREYGEPTGACNAELTKQTSESLRNPRMGHPFHLSRARLDGAPLARSPFSEPPKSRFRNCPVGASTRLKPEEATAFDGLAPTPGVEVNPSTRRSGHYSGHPQGAVNSHSVAAAVRSQTESVRGLSSIGKGTSIGAPESIDLEELGSFDPQHALDEGAKVVVSREESLPGHGSVSASGLTDRA